VRLYVVIQGIVTVSLLVFAYVMRDVDRSISTLVVTAAVAFWLSEAPRSARTLANGVPRRDNGDGGEQR
jgi:hypothetical protein